MPARITVTEPTAWDADMPFWAQLEENRHRKLSRTIQYFTGNLRKGWIVLPVRQLRLHQGVVPLASRYSRIDPTRTMTLSACCRARATLFWWCSATSSIVRPAGSCNESSSEQRKLVSGWL